MLRNYRRGMISYDELCHQIKLLKGNPDHNWTEEELSAAEYVGDDYLRQKGGVLCMNIGHPCEKQGQ